MARRKTNSKASGSRQETARLKALDAAVQDLTRRFGDGSIIRLGEAGGLTVDVIPTGSLGLDIALGVGGLPRGRVVEIYGPESSGKTTLCLHVIAEAQRLGGLAAFIDMEHALDPIYAERLGVDVDTLYISQPDTGEQALEIAEALVRSGALDVVVVDSVAALVPRAEIEGEMGDSHVGLQARLMSQALRKLSGAIKQSNTAVLFTNQIREKVGVMYGSPETQPGGRALKFYASVRLDIRRIQGIKQSGSTIGNRTRVRVTKNKVAPPLPRDRVRHHVLRAGASARWARFWTSASALEIIQKRGAFYRYNEALIGQGRENARRFLQENPAVQSEIEDAVRANHGPARRWWRPANRPEGLSVPRRRSAWRARQDGAWRRERCHPR